MDVIELAGKLYPALSGHPFMGCDCCAESVTSGVEFDPEEDSLWDQLRDLDTLWLMALDLAAVALGVTREN